MAAMGQNPPPLMWGNSVPAYGMDGNQTAAGAMYQAGQLTNNMMGFASLPFRIAWNPWTGIPDAISMVNGARNLGAAMTGKGGGCLAAGNAVFGQAQGSATFLSSNGAAAGAVSGLWRGAGVGASRGGLKGALAGGFLGLIGGGAGGAVAGGLAKSGGMGTTGEIVAGVLVGAWFGQGSGWWGGGWFGRGGAGSVKPGAFVPPGAGGEGFSHPRPGWAPPGWNPPPPGPQ
jgi:hypothetical protein